MLFFSLLVSRLIIFVLFEKNRRPKQKTEKISTFVLFAKKKKNRFMDIVKLKYENLIRIVKESVKRRGNFFFGFRREKRLASSSTPAKVGHEMDIILSWKIKCNFNITQF